jgi:hypothetical protein
VHVVAVTDNEGSSMPANRPFHRRNVHPVRESANDRAQKDPEQPFVCRYGHGMHAAHAVHW